MTQKVKKVLKNFLINDEDFIILFKSFKINTIYKNNIIRFIDDIIINDVNITTDKKYLDVSWLEVDDVIIDLDKTYSLYTYFLTN